MLTLEDLIGQSELGLELLTGGPEALRRPLVGAHSMEVGRPLTWLEPGWIMLTIGMRLRDSPDEQRRLIADAADGGLAGIGFGIGIVYDEVPDALLIEARRRDFAIFTVPVELPFRVIVDAVNRSLLSEHIAVAQRSLSIQRYLMDTLSSLEPRDDLVTRLAQVLQSCVIVFRHDGRVLLRRGGLPTEDLWTEVCVREPREQEFKHAGLQVRSTPVTISGGPTEWLVVASPHDAVPAPLAREVVRGASRLLGVLGRARRVAVLEERGARAKLLARLAEGDVEPADVDRLRIFALQVADGVRVTALGLVPDERVGRRARSAEEPAARLVEAVENALERTRLPYLLCPTEQGALVLASHARLDVNALVADVVRAGSPVAASSGRIVHEATGVAASAQDSRIGLAGLLRGGPAPGTAITVDDFDLAEWLITKVNGSAGHRADRSLARLKEHPEMHQTLVAYIKADLNVKLTAKALNLHPNSLRYRLSRIEEILERPLDRVSSIVDLYLALLIDDSEVGVPGG